MALKATALSGILYAELRMFSLQLPNIRLIGYIIILRYVPIYLALESNLVNFTVICTELRFFILQ